MKTREDVRLACLQLANSLGCAKMIPPHAVLGYAQEFLDWIDEKHESGNADLDKLRGKFKVIDR